MLADGYMGKLNSSQKKSLSTIITATNRMNELISTLLNITRMESGTIEITPKTLQIDKIAEEIIKELSLMAEGKSIALSTITKGGGNSAIKTDALIVKEVITNLVSNAIKYTPEAGRVSLVIKPRPANIVIEVVDSGWGIPKYSQDQVFSKFFRAQNVVKRETTGTGLGLYLVKGLVDALGGRIWFVSDEEKGTTFSFSLPRQSVLSNHSKKLDRVAD
jgi:signal transduction histidine kinase